MKLRKIQNKKALSGVVSVLIMVLISILAVTIMWVAIRELTRPETILAPKSCIDFQINMPYELEGTCYNSENQEVVITMAKKYDKYKVDNINFLIDNRTKTSTWCCGEDCQNCKLPTTIPKQYFLPFTEKPLSVTLEISGCTLETKNIRDC